MACKLMMERVKYVIQVLCSNETIGKLVMANNVHWYGHVLNR